MRIGETSITIYQSKESASRDFCFDACCELGLVHRVDATDALRASPVLRNEDEVCAASGIVNFIWANLMLKRFGGADCQETPNEIVKKFDRLIQH